MACSCTVTRDKKCVDCGRRVYEVETRSCGECKHFKLDHGANVIGMCRPKLMTVTKSMNVTYEVRNGTCFEAKK